MSLEPDPHELEILASRGIFGEDARTALTSYHLVGTGMEWARVDAAFRACGYTPK